MSMTVTPTLNGIRTCASGLRCEGRQPRVLVAFVTATWAILFAIRLLGPPDLMDNDQERPAAYVMDAAVNGNWICQRDVSGAVSSKPPFYTWLAGLATVCMGRITPFTLYLPSALATLAVAWLLLAFGSIYFGRGAGFFAAVVYLLSPIGAKQILLARTDPLFALTVAVAALCAWTAFAHKSGWTVFWVAAAAATLTKGPLGVLLAFGGLFATLWERRRGDSPWKARGSHLPGLVLFLSITLGWFVTAYFQIGHELIERMIGKELIGHALTDGKGRLPGQGFYKPFLYFLSRFGPWSILACLGLWRVWRHPAGNDSERFFERFLFCWFFFGILVFSIGAHKRPDHLFPLIPAAALLAGREIRNIVRSWPVPSLVRVTAALAAVLLVGAGFYYQLVRIQDDEVVRTRGMKQLASIIRQRVGNQFPLIHVDSPFALQFYLNTVRKNVAIQEAAGLFSYPEAVFVVLRASNDLQGLLIPDDQRVYEVARWPESGEPYLRIVSNYPRLEYTSRMATFADGIRVRMRGLQLQRARDGELLFWAKSPHARLILSNVSPSRRKLHVRIINVKPEVIEQRELNPGETWQLETGKQKTTQDVLNIGQIADCRQAYAQREWLAKTGALAELDYIFVNGDFVFESDWRYDLFLAQACKWQVPIFPVLGNHDIIKNSPYPTESFQNRFGYLAHRFADGPARFLLLDTSRKTLSDDQFVWLEQTLHEGTDRPVTCIFQHVPPDSLGGESVGSASEIVWKRQSMRGKNSSRRLRSFTQNLQGRDFECSLAGRQWVGQASCLSHRLEAGATQCWYHLTVVPALELHRLIDFWLKLRRPGEIQSGLKTIDLSTRPEPSPILGRDNFEGLETTPSGKPPTRIGQRLLGIAAQAGVDRIYCGHRNIFSATDYPTPYGTVRVVVSGGGGEKTREKEYGQHWLQIQIAAGKIVETTHEIPLPSRIEGIGAHIRWRDLFLLRKYGLRILFLVCLAVLLVFGARKAGCAVQSNPKW